MIYSILFAVVLHYSRANSSQLLRVRVSVKLPSRFVRADLTLATFKRETRASAGNSRTAPKTRKSTVFINKGSTRCFHIYVADMYVAVVPSREVRAAVSEILTTFRG